MTGRTAGREPAARRREAVDRHVPEELRAHFEELVAEQMRAGKGRAEAEVEARRRFGSLDRHLRASLKARRRLRRGGRRTALLTGLAQDSLFALRSLAARPAFTLGAVLLLAAGIGVASGLFWDASPSRRGRRR